MGTSFKTAKATDNQPPPLPRAASTNRSDRNQAVVRQLSQTCFARIELPEQGSGLPKKSGLGCHGDATVGDKTQFCEGLFGFEMFFE
jgi:hypothetical protein